VLRDFNSLDLNKIKKVFDSVSFAKTDRDKNKAIKTIPNLFIASNLNKICSQLQHIEKKRSPKEISSGLLFIVETKA
jgi:hypothetical protein